VGAGPDAARARLRSCASLTARGGLISASETSARSGGASAAGAAPSSGLRIGPVEFVPGITRGNVAALGGAAFFSIGLMTLVGNMQPYLFNEMLHIPIGQQGRLSSYLGVTSEIVVLALAGLTGAASDKLGRRRIYAFGFLMMSIAFCLFPLVQGIPGLFATRVIFAVGATFLAAMLATVIADYPVERSRGRLVGGTFFLNGLGVATLVGTATMLPRLYQGAGYDAFEAGQAAYWTIAGVMLIPLVIVARGLAPGAPHQADQKAGLFATMRIGIEAGRQPRVLLAYLAGCISRGDLSIISTFFLLWMTRAGLDQGMTAAEALAAGGKYFAVIQISATLWAVVVVFFIDRFDRVLALAGAAVLTCASYVTIGLIDDPFQPKMYAAAAFMGIGEMSAVLAAQSLIGQVAPEKGRGAVIGMFTFCGAIGIFAAELTGGYLFDHWRPSAPYIVMGLAAGVLAIVAFGVWLATRHSVAPAPATG
jgi:MFS family permease